MYPLIIIVGPTAVGKSALSIGLAQALDGEIISGDSVQIYKRLDIGSAKPSLAERRNIPHHLLDILDPNEPFTVADFQQLASTIIEDVRSRGKIPILVGGTGLYIRSLLDPFDFSASGSEEIRAKWYKYLAVHGKNALHEALRDVDPESARRLHPNDYVRVIRALEVYELTGIPFSQQRDYHEREYSPLSPTIIYLGLSAPREVLYERINQRCEEMIERGLIEELSALVQEGYSPKLKPLQSIGYRHAFWYLAGLVTKPEMTRLLKRDTRHYAKRQSTWFKRDPRLTWFDVTTRSVADIIEQVYKTCRERQTRVK